MLGESRAMRGTERPNATDRPDAHATSNRSGSLLRFDLERVENVRLEGRGGRHLLILGYISHTCRAPTFPNQRVCILVDPNH